MFEWLFVPLAYLAGSISSAILVCRLMKLPDPRDQGSGNPGATNVMRIGGKKAAAITLLGDLLKGLLPVYLANLMNVSSEVLAMTGLAAFAGHLYPVFFAFKGGKGVATSLGVLLGFSWWVGLIFAVFWLSIYKITKISSLSALIASSVSPLVTWYLTKNLFLLTAALAMTLVLLWRHKSNIQRLLAGQET